MKIIISPAKQMSTVDNVLQAYTTPSHIQKSQQIITTLKSKSPDTLKTIWSCNDKILQENISRLETIDLENATSPALLSYDGIQYKYMAPIIFEEKMFEYVQKHLRILSALYGTLRPFDTVTPYRLEMQAKLQIENAKNLYNFWGDTIYQDVRDDDGIIINLASKEYSKTIMPFLKDTDTFITCVFAELHTGKLVQKGVYAKMARGEMVRYMAENGIKNIESIKDFVGGGYEYSKEHSRESEFVFIKK